LIGAFEKRHSPAKALNLCILMKTKNSNFFAFKRFFKLKRSPVEVQWNNFMIKAGASTEMCRRFNPMADIHKEVQLAGLSDTTYLRCSLPRIRAQRVLFQRRLGLNVRNDVRS
jgi:hypothetical protein